MTTAHYMNCSFERDSLLKNAICSGDNNVVVCLDGPPGIGKTLVSDVVIDYTCYLDEMLLCSKLRVLTERMMFINYTTMLGNLHQKINIFYDSSNIMQASSSSSSSLALSSADNKSQLLLNCSIFSSEIYSMFFKFNGHKLSPEYFKIAVEENIFNSPNILKIQYYWQQLLNSQSMYLPNFQSQLLWILPQNFKSMFNNLKTRKFFCMHRNSIILENYCKNLIYLFDRFAKITNFGDILIVGGNQVLRVDIENLYKKYNTINVYT